MNTATTKQNTTTSAAGHTPGPWVSVVPPSSCLTTRFIEGPSGEHIAKIGHLDYSSGDVFSDTANARLIAAAPELLEALIALDAECAARGMGGQDCMMKAKAAIARANGS